MNTVVTLVAQYLLYGLALVAGLVWCTRSRLDKVRMASEATAGLIVVVLGIVVAGKLHVDPRPFVHDPASQPLFAHQADNGFPSDHSAAGGLIAALVFRYKRLLGTGVAVGAVAMGAARVMAHVHHAQDVIAGLFIGAAGVALAVWITARVAAGLRRRGISAAPVARTTADRAQLIRA